jgi:F0F1-type ATP synthase assembly protein I
MAVGTVVGGWLGGRLDVWLASEPFGFVIGLALGFASGLITLYRGLFRPTAQDTTAPDDERTPDPPQ